MLSKISCQKMWSQLKTCCLRFQRIVIAICLCIASGANLFSQPVTAAESCYDVKLIFARGSGEELNGPSYTAWRDEITTAINDISGRFSYQFYELGSVAQHGYQYPAIAVSGDLEGFTHLLGAYFGSGEMYEFGRSVDEGMQELLAYIDTTLASCPKTKFVLGGYSQGAMLVSGLLSALDSSQIIYVSTFGDPKLYLPEGASTTLGIVPKIPDACRGRNLSPYRISVPDCYAYNGILGIYNPYQPTAYANKVGTWCNASDIMCSSGISISDHTAYVSSNLYRDAAAVIAQKLARAFPAQSQVFQQFRQAIHDIVFIIDTTSSMENVIDRYRDEAKILAARVKADGGNIALLSYRDLGEDYPTHEHCDFSCSLDTFSSAVDNLEISGGGSIDESALSAIMYALNRFDWQPGATKSIVLLTDAGYHPRDYDGTTLADIVQRSLEIDPVNIYVVTDNIFESTHAHKRLTDPTSGQVFVINKSDTTSLSNITDAIFDRPVAHLALSAYVGQVGDEFYFDASDSFALDGGELRFDWDLDGNGTFETLNSASVITHSYAYASSHYIQVRVTDQNGRFSTMSAQVTIIDEPPAPATISQLTMSDENHVVDFQTDGAKVLLVTNDLIRGFLEVKDGAGQFIFDNSPDDLTITLIPYSASGLRGVSRSLSMSPQDNPETPSPSSSSNPSSSSSSSSSSEPSSPGASEHNPASNIPPAGVPKAPNTGYISRELKCQ